MKKTVGITLTFIMLMELLCGCVSVDYSIDETTGEYLETADVEADNNEPEWTEEESTEPVVVLQGQYTLEDAREIGGLYLLCDDGSFNKYRAGGFCVGVDDRTRSDGMYLLDSIAEGLPSVNADTNMILFWDGDYYVSLSVINAQASAIQLFSEDGEKGYAMYARGSLEIDYCNYEMEIKDIEYINGIPVGDYTGIEKIEITYNSAKGMPSATYISQYWSLPKGETLTIGTADGTTLIETAYTVNATYYDFDSGHNHFELEDGFLVPTTPTVDGYAKLDFSGIPAGQYVMYIDGDTTYMATLINIE